MAGKACPDYSHLHVPTHSIGTKLYSVQHDSKIC